MPINIVAAVFTRPLLPLAMVAMLLTTACGGGGGGVAGIRQTADQSAQSGNPPQIRPSNAGTPTNTQNQEKPATTQVADADSLDSDSEETGDSSEEEIPKLIRVAGALFSPIARPESFEYDGTAQIRGRIELVEDLKACLAADSGCESKEDWLFLGEQNAGHRDAVTRAIHAAAGHDDAHIITDIYARSEYQINAAVASGTIPEGAWVNWSRTSSFGDSGRAAEGLDFDTPLLMRSSVVVAVAAGNRDPDLAGGVQLPYTQYRGRSYDPRSAGDSHNANWLQQAVDNTVAIFAYGLNSRGTGVHSYSSYCGRSVMFACVGVSFRHGDNWGTSFSAGLLSGTAWAMKSRWPALTSQQIVAIMVETARPLHQGDSPAHAKTGVGALDLSKLFRPVGTLVLQEAKPTYNPPKPEPESVPAPFRGITNSSTVHDSDPSAPDNEPPAQDEGPDETDDDTPAQDEEPVVPDNEPPAQDERPDETDDDTPAQDDEPSVPDSKPPAQDDGPDETDDDTPAQDDETPETAFALPPIPDAQIPRIQVTVESGNATIDFKPDDTAGVGGRLELVERLEKCLAASASSCERSTGWLYLSKPPTDLRYAGIDRAIKLTNVAQAIQAGAGDQNRDYHPAVISGIGPYGYFAANVNTYIDSGVVPEGSWINWAFHSAFGGEGYRSGFDAPLLVRSSIVVAVPVGDVDRRVRSGATLQYTQALDYDHRRVQKDTSWLGQAITNTAAIFVYGLNDDASDIHPESYRCGKSVMHACIGVSYGYDSHNPLNRGTAIATGLLSGTAWTMKSLWPHLTSRQIAAIMLATAKPLHGGVNEDTGVGALDFTKLFEPVGPLALDDGDPPAADDEPPAQDDEPVETEDETPAQDDEPVETEDETPAQDDEPVETEDETPAQDDEPVETEDETPAQDDEPSVPDDEPPAQDDEPVEIEDEAPGPISPSLIPGTQTPRIQIPVDNAGDEIDFAYDSIRGRPELVDALAECLKVKASGYICKRATNWLFQGGDFSYGSSYARASEHQRRIAWAIQDAAGDDDNSYEPADIATVPGNPAHLGSPARLNIALARIKIPFVASIDLHGSWISWAGYSSFGKAYDPEYGFDTPLLIRSSVVVAVPVGDAASRETTRAYTQTESSGGVSPNVQYPEMLQQAVLNTAAIFVYEVSGNRIGRKSNYCGPEVMHACIGVPGSTNFGVARLSGVAWTMKSLWPHLTSRQIAAIMLETARPLHKGGGVSERTGVGALDLTALFEPAGTLVETDRYQPGIAPPAETDPVAEAGITRIRIPLEKGNSRIRFKRDLLGIRGRTELVEELRKCLDAYRSSCTAADNWLIMAESNSDSDHRGTISFAIRIGAGADINRFARTPDFIATVHADNELDINQAIADKTIRKGSWINWSRGSRFGDSDRTNQPPAFDTSLLVSNSIVVAVAAGNLGNDAFHSSTENLGIHANEWLGQAILNTSAIVVYGLNRKGTDIHFDSHYCGTLAMRACIGVDYRVAYLRNGAYRSYGDLVRQGTAYSTSLLSGSAWVMKSLWPHLTSRQIADIMLKTARPLRGGINEITGVGALDFAALFEPTGALVESSTTYTTISAPEALISRERPFASDRTDLKLDDVAKIRGRIELAEKLKECVAVVGGGCKVATSWLYAGGPIYSGSSTYDNDRINLGIQAGAGDLSSNYFPAVVSFPGYRSPSSFNHAGIREGAWLHWRNQVAFGDSNSRFGLDTPMLISNSVVVAANVGQTKFGGSGDTPVPFTQSVNYYDYSTRDAFAEWLNRGDDQLEEAIENTVAIFVYGLNDAATDIHPRSNYCGTRIMEACIGVVYQLNDWLYNQRGVWRLERTDISSAVLSGAAWTMKSLWPHLTSQQIAAIMLNTARPLRGGVNEVTGVGALDLAALLEPVGSLGSGDLSAGDLAVERGYLHLPGLTDFDNPEGVDSFARNFQLVTSSVSIQPGFSDFDMDRFTPAGPGSRLHLAVRKRTGGVEDAALAFGHTNKLVLSSKYIGVCRDGDNTDLCLTTTKREDFFGGQGSGSFRLEDTTYTSFAATHKMPIKDRLKLGLSAAVTEARTSGKHLVGDVEGRLLQTEISLRNKKDTKSRKTSTSMSIWGSKFDGSMDMRGKQSPLHERSYGIRLRWKLDF